MAILCENCDSSIMPWTREITAALCSEPWGCFTPTLIAPKESKTSRLHHHEGQFPRGPLFHTCALRGPAAILFISRDTCSDSIAKLFRACFNGGIAQLSSDTLQNGVSHKCPCVKLSTKGGVSHHLGGVLTSLKKYRAIWGIAAIVSQYRACLLRVNRQGCCTSSGLSKGVALQGGAAATLTSVALHCATTRGPCRDKFLFVSSKWRLNCLTMFVSRRHGSLTLCDLGYPIRAILTCNSSSAQAWRARAGWHTKVFRFLVLDS